MGGMAAARLGLVAVLSALAFVAAAPAQAAFPGQNGKIAFESAQSGDSEIYTVDPAGGSPVQITDNSVGDFRPVWSPDGTKLAFARSTFGCDDTTSIWTMNADGSNQQSGGPCGRDASWSPDGQQIAYTNVDYESGSSCISVLNADGTFDRTLICDSSRTITDVAWSPSSLRLAFSADQDVFTIFSDGTNLRNLTNTPSVAELDPNWSPNTPLNIAFLGTGPPHGIWVMNYEGSDATPIKGNGASYPAWSPDGQKLAYVDLGPPFGIWTMSSDGTGAAFRTSGSAPDWQPVPYTGYPRPKGATPMYAPLVPAYTPCTSPNRTHGPPLAYGSCAPPVQASPHLRMGTPDANGAAANLIGSLRLDALVGAPGSPDDSDIKINLSITDVRCRNAVATCASANSPGDLAGPDYTGQVLISLGRGGMRITDRFNAVAGGGGSDPATGQDMDFTVPVSCSATTSTAIGGTCAIVTSANAVVPGAITDGKRTIVELAQAKVFDAGQDGVLSTPGDGSLFLEQGLFVP